MEERSVLRQATAESLARALEAGFAALPLAVAAWHEKEPQVEEDIPVAGQDAGAPLLAELLAVHLANFKLWHLEDAARRDDLGPEHVARAKRAIDAMNQRRNDRIELLDAKLESLIASFLPPETPQRHNTETMGNGLDRLSILHLKLYHMRQETTRQDAGPGHVERCRRRLELLERQRRDLERGLLELLGDYAEGRKRPMIYHQFKMYNDPETNPELYGKNNA